MKWNLSAEVDKNNKDDYLKLWRLKQKDSQEVINWVLSHIADGISFKCYRKDE